VSFLVQHGARVDATDDHGRTALSWTITKGDFAGTLKVLIEAGADINKADGDNYTPLMRAAIMDHPQCFKLLVESGADVTPVHLAWGKAAPEIALERGSERLKEIVNRMQT
jgi:ankyrin repeat protein